MIHRPHQVQHQMLHPPVTPGHQHLREDVCDWTSIYFPQRHEIKPSLTPNTDYIFLEPNPDLRFKSKMKVLRKLTLGDLDEVDRRHNSSECTSIARTAPASRPDHSWSLDLYGWGASLLGHAFPDKHNKNILLSHPILNVAALHIDTQQSIPFRQGHQNLLAQGSCWGGEGQRLHESKNFNIIMIKNSYTLWN